MVGPGRSCPLGYRTRPEDLASAPALAAETLYVIGGLYGNPFALEAVFDRVEQEVAAGAPAPRLLFNGDFNWFNVGAPDFRAINERVLVHHAMQGNVEAELATPSPDAGCGCAYPEWVDVGVVERSNRIIQHLQAAAAPYGDLRERLGALPRQFRAIVGDLRVGVVHGDPDSLAGWGLAVEAMPAPGEPSARIADWLDRGNVDLLASTHTCLPVLQTLPGTVPGVVVNNGAAGMPNFRGDPRGLVTRIATRPAPVTTIAGVVWRGVHVDLLPLQWDRDACMHWFDWLWPDGSDAAISYRERLLGGPAFDPADAFRV